MPETRTRLDTYQRPRFAVGRPLVVETLIDAIDGALSAVKAGTLGPYGALERIIAALDDFAEAETNDTSPS